MKARSVFERIVAARCAAGEAAGPRAGGAHAAREARRVEREGAAGGDGGAAQGAHEGLEARRRVRGADGAAGHADCGARALAQADALRVREPVERARTQYTLYSTEYSLYSYSYTILAADPVKANTFIDCSESLPSGDFNLCLLNDLYFLVVKSAQRSQNRVTDFRSLVDALQHKIKLLEEELDISKRVILISGLLAERSKCI